MKYPNQAFWDKRSVFITGHTGFKGSWLSIWLNQMGSLVNGYALAPNTKPSMYELCHLNKALASDYIADIRDFNTLQKCMNSVKPEIVFHLAAQPLVRKSYKNPLETWSTNVLGTANLLEAVRNCKTVKAVIVVTTDKCYENKEWPWGYRESDRLGGHDPYSASKAAAELVVQSYRRSFDDNNCALISSVRAGNVIGGGDFSEDRLIPDVIRSKNLEKKLILRNPNSIRPWQHVLEPLNGYLLLAESLCQGNRMNADAFNFGPDASSNLSVLEILNKIKYHPPFDSLHVDINHCVEQPHETCMLRLDSSKALQMLGWKPRWSIDETIEKTACWYSSLITGSENLKRLTTIQIKDFISPLC